jgi:hypothetical protein
MWLLLADARMVYCILGSGVPLHARMKLHKSLHTNMLKHSNACQMVACCYGRLTFAYYERLFAAEADPLRALA